MLDTRIRTAAVIVALTALVAVGSAPVDAVVQRLDPRFEVGEPFPLIPLPSLEDGTPTTIAAYRGDKILLHVFASW